MSQCNRPRVQMQLGVPQLPGDFIDIALEQRGVNRALREAYGIGLCSVEKLGWLTGSPGSTKDQTQPITSPNQNRSNNGQPRLRDRLCVLTSEYSQKACYHSIPNSFVIRGSARSSKPRLLSLYESMFRKFSI